MTQGEAVLKDGAGSQNAGLNRWGDYSTTRTFDPANDVWIGVGYREFPGNCGTAGTVSSAALVVFGRARDTNEYTRWSNK